MKLDAALVCDRGLSPKRSINEDRALVLLDRGLFVVCDGIGGHSSGEVASQLAVDTIEEALGQADGRDMEALLENAVQYANRDIFEASLATEEFFGMGTTVALLHADVVNRRAVIGHAGDSRVYRFDGNSLHRETYDHTDVEDLLRSGRLSHEQAFLRGKQNTINRALGIEAEVQAEFKTIPLSEGASFLLCSDGVNRHMADDELEELMQDELSPADTVAEIKRRCYARGAEDNLTAIVVTTAEARVTAPAKRRTTRPIAARAGGASGSLVRDVPSPAEATAGSAPSIAPSAIPKSVTLRRSPIGPVTVIAAAVVLSAGWFAIGRISTRWIAPAGTTPPPASSARDAFDRGDFPVARAGFATLLLDEPKRADYHFWLGRSLLETGEPREAAIHLEEAVKLDPSLHDALLFLSVAYEADGRSREASDSLRRYVQVASPSAEPAPAGSARPHSSASRTR
ncbi:MAG: tetratricopeptide repeat protein [Acidobacteria bacterium]|nr:tetratricopeptide repeat protein [Acidobacteriota bacterium]